MTLGSTVGEAAGGGRRDGRRGGGRRGRRRGLEGGLGGGRRVEQDRVPAHRDLRPGGDRRRAARRERQGEAGPGAGDRQGRERRLAERGRPTRARLGSGGGPVTGPPRPTLPVAPARTSAAVTPRETSERK